MSSFQYKEEQIHYISEGTGPALILVHGLGGNSSNWIYQRTYFKDRYQVISLDLPGHGKSSGGDTLPFEDFQQVVYELLQELNIESAFLCGISMGGKVVLDFAYHHPDVAEKIILADTFAGLDESDKARRKAIYDLIYEPDGTERWVSRVINSMGLDPEGPIAKGFYKGIQQNDLNFIYRLFMNSMNYDQRPQLAMVHAPALIIHGERDQFISYDCSEDLHLGLIHSQLEVIPKCGHLPHVEKPQLFNQLVKSFIH